MINKSLSIILLILSQTSNAEIIRSGLLIVGPGFITKGCVYGENESLSDHAPIVWEEQKVATWNITSQVSHRRIQAKDRTFLNHKFRTNVDETLITVTGKPAIAGFQSEMNDPTDLSRNLAYSLRLQRIAKKIIALFDTYKLDSMALQETPRSKRFDAQGREFQKVLAESLAPDLVIHYAESSDTKKRQPDVAIVSRAATKISKYRDDADNALHAFCDSPNKTCIISVHLPQAFGRLLTRHCANILTFVQKLQQEGHNRVLAVGDFNATDRDIFKSCSTLANFTPEIRSYAHKPASCKDNEGHASDRRLDLMLNFGKSDTQ